MHTHTKTNIHNVLMAIFCCCCCSCCWYYSPFMLKRSTFPELSQVKPVPLSVFGNCYGRTLYRPHAVPVTQLYSLFFIISDRLMSRLQSVQNATAHLVTGTRRCNHKTPVLCLLYYTGYWYASTSISRLPHMFISRCPEILHHT